MAEMEKELYQVKTQSLQFMFALLLGIGLFVACYSYFAAVKIGAIYVPQIFEELSVGTMGDAKRQQYLDLMSKIGRQWEVTLWCGIGIVLLSGAGLQQLSRARPSAQSPISTKEP